MTIENSAMVTLTLLREDWAELAQQGFPKETEFLRKNIQHSDVILDRWNRDLLTLCRLLSETGLQEANRSRLVNLRKMVENAISDYS